MTESLMMALPRQVLECSLMMSMPRQVSRAGGWATLSYATLGGEGGYHLRLAGRCVLKVYLLELIIVTLKPCRLSEDMDTSSID
jgi:hypothetical protein